MQLLFFLFTNILSIYLNNQIYTLDFFNKNLLPVNNFRFNLKYLHYKFGLTQEEIAKQVGKQKTTISNWEAGASEPDIDELIALSKFFHVKLDTLILVNMEKLDLITDEQVLEFSKSRKLKKHPVEYDTGDLPDQQVNEKEEPLFVQLLGELKKLNGNVGKLRIEVKKTIK